MSGNYGDDFQQKSKYTRENLPRHYLDWEHKPDLFKKYEDAIERIELPDPSFNDNISFWDIIRKRHSTRKFADEKISLESLSLILTAINGITRIERGFPFRTVPSAGGLFPIETYVSINNVEKLDSGLYHYYLPKHELECIQKGNFKKLIAQACLGQAIAAKSALNFIWTAIIERSKWKYLQRCYRYIYLDAGHIGQNFYLAAEALGLGACTIGAIFDDELNEILSIDGIQETALYVGVLGKK